MAAVHLNILHPSNYPEATNQIGVFAKYQYISAKDHERMWRASEVVIDFDLSIASHLPMRNEIIKSISENLPG